jgi:uridine phosphorylase
MSIHLHPTAPTAPDALLPGDPGRALALAQELLVSPKMSNHHRGLWGYYGETRLDGRPLTIQSTGIGGPSAAIVLTELAELGLRRAVRIGTGVAASEEVGIGSLLVSREAMASDGTSQGMGAGDVVPAAEDLTEALAAALPQARQSTVATVDVYYPGTNTARIAVGIDAYEMATAPLYVLGRRLGLDVGCVLAIAATPDGERIAEEELLRVELEMGRAATAALARTAV